MFQRNIRQWKKRQASVLLLKLSKSAYEILKKLFMVFDNHEHQ